MNMREILFRGKISIGETFDRPGEWIYGDLSQNDDGSFWITERSGKHKGESHDVDPCTVGEYTGANDKTGIKIFEGDIVKSGDTIGEIKYGNFLTEKIEIFFEYNLINPIHPIGFAVLCNNNKYIIPVNEQYTVIGNIHETPHLIPKGKEI